MRVSLNPVRPTLPGVAPARPPALLDPRGPRVILGAPDGIGALAAPVKPAADAMFGPRGVALASEGTLVVSDSGHHRLLIWSSTPTADDAPADILIGQPDFGCEGRNAKGPVGPATLNVPTGVAISQSGMLAVADAWNHRVLLWNAVPRAHNQPADVVLGQADFTGNLANRGGATGPDTLDWCYGVSFIGDSLVVCDTGNRRVLIWRAVPSENGTPADIVLGQREMTSRDESAGADVGPVGMRWPHMTALVAGNFLVADAGMNRVMIWNGLPDTDGAPCHAVLGQATLGDQDHNRAAYYPTATALNMPYGLAESGGRLLVADTANSRLVGWSTDAIGMDAPATMLAGQHTFTAKGDNRWAAAARDSLCWPYGLGAYGSTVVIADSGNNRVLIWDVAS